MPPPPANRARERAHIGCDSAASERTSVDKLCLRALRHAAVPLAIPTEIDRSVIRITSAAAARLYPAEHARCVPRRDRGRRAMRFVVQKPVLKAFAVVVACAALVVAMQAHLWLARAAI